MSYSELERMGITRWGYSTLKLGKNKKIDGKNVGTVSQINSKSTGEQSYVMTNTGYVPEDAPLTARSQVTQVTVIYRGSSANRSIDTLLDWGLNDIPTGVQVINQGGAVAMPQLHSASDTLNTVLKKYPNAQVDVYGHSLASMDGQYALANVDFKDAGRVHGYLYEGPNIYDVLSPKQQKMADLLTENNQILNYIDLKDLVAMGYSHHGKTVGVPIFVLSKIAKGLVDQHMWGGYQFDKDGNLITADGSGLGLAEAELTEEQKLNGSVKKKLLQMGSGGLTDAQKIYLDANEAYAVVNGLKVTIESKIQELEKMYKDDSKNANELWKTTRENAQYWGEHLSSAEEEEALDRGGATKGKVVIQRVNENDQAIAKLGRIKSQYETLMNKIKTTINKQINEDNELRQMFK